MLSALFIVLLGSVAALPMLGKQNADNLDDSFGYDSWVPYVPLFTPSYTPQNKETSKPAPSKIYEDDSVLTTPTFKFRINDDYLVKPSKPLNIVDDYFKTSTRPQLKRRSNVNPGGGDLQRRGRYFYIAGSE
ncbi:hypothetical protein NEOLI_003697 [Neolecta irregularis DAH-3]|uniref:Uncharacterized protein n=1 Tax=Neolecta irregularis (strain DAH-3) TaxID=1198029 RepID=A0A1U7LUD5_NEOID|nr:hypothetical protein NEOLI_003697 [Neolecta irregularis DAH-3]|eukprot:OLL26277.1 hypothetical protein NEOLI_003697 [Neolecta irregularis DAH-3]